MTPTPQNPRNGRIDPVADWSRPPAAHRPGPARPPTPAWRDRRYWRWAALLVVVLAVALVSFRGRIAEAMWPDTQVQRLLSEGERALAEGRLTAADGSGARQRFEAALALDSDRSEASDGLRRVGNASLLRASSALRAGRLDEARAALALARELQVPSAATDAIAEALRLQDSQSNGVALLLQRARLAHDAGQLDGSEDSALPLYQRVLSLEPQMTTALEGREDALTDMLQQARAALEEGRPGVAARLVERARHFDPGHVELPAVQAELARTMEARRTRAAALLSRGRLDAATSAYRQVLEAVPDDAVALQALERIGAQYAERSQRLAADFEFDAAEVLLEKARELSPEGPEVGSAQMALARARRAQLRLEQPIAPARREARLNAILGEMSAAEERGNWLTPPGESAFDKLRAAQALWPDHASVRRATTRLVPATRECFEDELRGNRIGRARSCYDAWLALDPGSAQLADARRRLAQKWVAVGTERLGAGDVAFATRALQEARALDADAPGVDEFGRRVTAAQSGGG